jgi:hypothetical protein
VKSLLDSVDNGLCGLKLLTVLFKARHPDVNELVAEQLIGGERQQHLKFLNGQLQARLSGIRFVPDFLSSLICTLEELCTSKIAPLCAGLGISLVAALLLGRLLSSLLYEISSTDPIAYASRNSQVVPAELRSNHVRVRSGRMPPHGRLGNDENWLTALQGSGLSGLEWRFFACT